MKSRAPHDGVYARIGPSRIDGVGVRVVWASRAAVRRLPKAFRALRRARTVSRSAP